MPTKVYGAQSRFSSTFSSLVVSRCQRAQSLAWWKVSLDWHTVALSEWHIKVTLSETKSSVLFMHKRCSLSIAKAITSSTLMRHGYPVLTLDALVGTLATTQTLNQIMSSVKESIWLQQSHLKVSHGSHLHSVIQMKRWCKCSFQG